jgi:hypothetical protein
VQPRGDTMQHKGIGFVQILEESAYPNHQKLHKNKK